MSIRESISNLKKVNEMLDTEKEYSSAMVECARMLIDEDEIHEIKDLSLAASAKIATIENNYAEYGRIGVHSKKFTAKQK
jgi:antitoxin component HigA of HigAB toxin-antitoxin module